ncbi:hypothetical protein [Streptomyces sp. NPDC047028]|uniref:hypothetical protein n=1 Tax=Streptomyces sp. NPDC047028 TaxID=3155793 RepID=UPI00340CA82A
MRSPVGAVLDLLLPPRGRRRAGAVPSYLAARWAGQGVRSRPQVEVVFVDGAPLVRPYLVLWERERDALEGCVGIGGAV